MGRWLSGRKHPPAKRVGGVKLPRGFESLPSRHWASSRAHRSVCGLPPHVKQVRRLERTSVTPDRPPSVPTGDHKSRPQVSKHPRVCPYPHVSHASCQRDRARLPIDMVNPKDHDMGRSNSHGQAPGPGVNEVVNHYLAGQHRLVWTEHICRRDSQLLERPGSILTCADGELKRAYRRECPKELATFLSQVARQLQFSRSLELGRRELRQHDLSRRNPGRTVPPPPAVAGELAHVARQYARASSSGQTFASQAIRTLYGQPKAEIPPFPPLANMRL